MLNTSASVNGESSGPSWDWRVPILAMQLAEGRSSQAGTI
jgi:hypothetical protein